MTRSRIALAVLAAVGILLLPLPAAMATGPDTYSTATGGPEGWRLPVADAIVVAPFVAPAHAYGPGHRGVDVTSGSGSADVIAASAGVIAFAGPVAGRGVITIDHGGGWVTSAEPVDRAVEIGDVVAAGEVIGTLSTGGHASTGTLHVGVRLDGVYVNPLALVREIPAAVLLPCCD